MESRPSGAELPTLFLAHARTGELPALAEAARAAPQHATYRVCARPADGSTLSVTKVLGEETADAVLLPALTAASWQLTGAKGGEDALCFLENLESAPDGSWKAAAEPYLLAGPERLERRDDAVPQLPEGVARRLVGQDVVGLYRMCASARSGEVASVSPVVSVPGADGAITEALRSWRYQPVATESCWIEPLRFTLTAEAVEPVPLDLNKQPHDHRFQ